MPDITRRMLFLREFAAAEMGGHDTNGTEPSAEAVPAKSRPQTIASSGIANSGEAFVPTYVYEAMKENKRFDSMRVGHSVLRLYPFFNEDGLAFQIEGPPRRCRGIHGVLPRNAA